MGRSDGFKQKCFQRQNKRERKETEGYAWGVDDIKREKRKIWVQPIKNEKGKRAGRIN